MQRRINGGGDIDLPFVEPEFRIIIDYLFDVGPVSNGGMGPVPLSWLDLDVWQRNIGISLSPWILRLLRELSGTYILESKRSEAEDAPPPWNVVPDRQKVAGHIKKLFRG